jgi:hypothetical protein
MDAAAEKIARRVEQEYHGTALAREMYLRKLLFYQHRRRLELVEARIEQERNRP